MTPLEISVLILILICFVLLTGILMQYSRSRDDKGLRLALVNMNDALLTTDRHGRVTGLNEIASALTGWPQKDAIGKPVADVLRLVDHDTREMEENPAQQVLKTGKMTNPPGISMLVARDGSERPVDINAAPVHGAGGRIRGVVLVFRDIFGRYMAEQKLLESEERLRAVTNEIRIGLVMINRDRRYVYANNFYQQILGIQQTTLIGKRVGDVLPVLYEQIRPNLDKAFAGERLSYEVKGLHKKEQGLNRIFSVTYEPQKRQSLVMHVVIVVVDITDMKRAAEALAKQDAS